MNSPPAATPSSNLDNMPRGPSPHLEVRITSRDQQLIATIDSIRNTIDAAQTDLAEGDETAAYTRLIDLCDPGLKYLVQVIRNHSTDALARNRRLFDTLSGLRQQVDLAAYFLNEHEDPHENEIWRAQAQLMRVDEGLAVVALELAEGDTGLLNGGVVDAQPVTPGQLFGDPDGSELAAELAPLTLAETSSAAESVSVHASVIVDATTGAILTEPVPSTTMPHLIPEPVPASVLMDPSTGAMLTEPVPEIPGAALLPVAMQSPLPVPADVLVDPLTGEGITRAITRTTLVPAPLAPALASIDPATGELLLAAEPQSGPVRPIPWMQKPPLEEVQLLPIDSSTLPPSRTPGAFSTLEPTPRTSRVWDVVVHRATGEIFTTPVPEGLPLDPGEPFPSFVDPYPVGPVQFIGAGAADLPVPATIPDAFSVMEPVLQPIDWTAVGAPPLTPVASMPATAVDVAAGQTESAAMSPSLAQGILDNAAAAGMLLSDPTTAGSEGAMPDTRPTADAGPALAAPTTEASTEARSLGPIPPGFERDEGGKVACKACGQSPGKPAA